MKTFLICTILLAFASCRLPKETNERPVDVTTSDVPVDHGSAPADEDQYVKGKVRLEENCGAVIVVKYGDVLKRYFPLNLEEKYKVDELTLKFSFVETEGELPDGVNCEAVIPVTVSEVTPYR